MDNEQADRILDVQQNLTSLIALGRPLNQCLQRIASEVETLFADRRCYCAILLQQEDKLVCDAAPSVDDDFRVALEGFAMSLQREADDADYDLYADHATDRANNTCINNEKENPGSLCGDVMVADLAADSYWEKRQGLVLSYGIQSCWTIQFASSDDRTLGCISIYVNGAHAPTKQELRLIKRFCALAGIAVERDQNDSKTKELNSALQHNTHRFESFAQAMPDLVIVFDQDGNYVDIYGSDIKSLILPVSLIKGRNVRDIMPPAKSARMLNVIKRCIAEQAKQTCEYELDVQTGKRVFEARVSPIRNYSPADPKKGHVVWVAQDISERKKADDTIRKLSFYDAITSLPNRRLLKERLNLHLRKARDRKLNGALLYIDIVDFKRVNEVLGVSGGDALIVEAAQRIADVLELQDSLARVGGDDFVVLVDKMQSNLSSYSNYLTDVATRVQSVFDKRFLVMDKKLRIQARVGISIFGSELVAPEKLISQAESAMYRAKERNQSVAFFDGRIQEMQAERIQMEYELEQAIRNDEISVHYQPQVDSNGMLQGMEALMRWHHPEMGFVSPLKFIPLAEELGIISALQEVVLRQVCDVIGTLEAQVRLPDNFRVAINISAIQFAKDDFENVMVAVLDQHQISASRITLEITESALIEDLDNAYTKMQRLRTGGFDLSIDDFGTGYSSLAYLQKLPADELKVDKSFVDAILESETGRNIVSAIIYLGRQLKCRVVVEGVETQEQADFLATQKTDLLQGYFFAKPMDLESLLNWVTEKSLLPHITAQRA